MHQLRRVQRGPVRVAQQRVVVGDRGRPAARAGQRVGEQRDRGALGELRDGGGKLAVALLAAGDEHRARAERQLLGEAFDEVLRRRAVDLRARDPRAAAGPAAGGGRQRVAVEHERLAQREVQVHRAGAAFEARPERAAGELAQPAQARRGRRRAVDLDDTTWRRAP